MTIAPSLAHRTIPTRDRGTGSRTGRLVDPYNRRELCFESGLEYAWLQVLIASPDVAEVREQQRLEIPYRKGKRVHFFDSQVFMKNGWVRARAVKYAKDVNDDLRQLLADAATHVGDRFANDYGLLTEKHLTRTMIWNSRQIISCAKDFDYEAQHALMGELAKAGEFVSVGACDHLLGDGRRGSRAAMALIKSGKLILPANTRLGRDTVLRNLFTN